MKKQDVKLSRVLIFTCTNPKELDVKQLKELNEKYISELCSNNEEKRSIFKIFKKQNIPGYSVIFLETGFGKLNSYRLLDEALRKIHENCTDNVMIKVVNLGAVGSGLGEVGSLVTCGRFIDVDLAFLELGSISESEWCNQMYKYIPDGTDLDPEMMYSCNSRDMLVTNMEDSFQRRDMWKVICDTEAFSQAKCCEDWSRLFNSGIKFSSTKYITHKFKEDALKEYENQVLKANEELTKIASKHLFNFYYAKN